MNELVYPKLPCKQDKRRKVCELLENQIKQMRKDGITFREISEKLHLTESTIYRIVYPRIAERTNNEVKKIVNERYHSDLNFRNKIIESSKKIRKTRYANDPNFRKYAKAYLKKWLSEHPDYWKKRYQKKKILKQKNEVVT